MKNIYKEKKHNNGMKYLLILLVLVISPFVLAETQTAERIPATVNEPYYVSQTCASCTYVNITIFNKDGIEVQNAAMTNNGSTWIYEFTPDTIGRHDVNGIYDMNGVADSFGFYFYSTPSGDSNQTLFFISIIGLIYFISFFGFFNKNPTITLIGGMGMMILGLYLITNGITIYRDWITNAIGAFTIAIGAYISFEAGYALIQEL